jgi:hypothetical protein
MTLGKNHNISKVMKALYPWHCYCSILGIGPAQDGRVARGKKILAGPVIQGDSGFFILTENKREEDGRL